MNVAIVVVAYNRKKPLLRLLDSLKQSDYTDFGDIHLIISIDYCGSNHVLDIAERFCWEYGKKTIISHEKNLGLRNHVLSCGDISTNYDAIIMLEDDLYVSPHFYKYAVEALHFYTDDESVGGVSLYGHVNQEYSSYPFLPLQTNADAYFIQTASSWGQAWSQKQWFQFRSWYDQHAYEGVHVSDDVPVQVASWSESSWKKYFNKYLIATDRYFVYPYTSYTTNFGDSGTHHKKTSTRFQSPLSLSGADTYSFHELNEESIVYDSFFELQPSYRFNHHFEQFDVYGTSVEFDLYGNKQIEQVRSEYLVSIKECNNPIISYGCELRPHELNILFNIPGDIFHIGLTIDFLSTISNEASFLQMDYYLASMNRKRRLIHYVLNSLKGNTFTR